MKQKKIFLIVLLCLFFLPFVVNAESGYLYDVLKNEAESNGLAREYTGEHHDSFTEEPSKKIYHWYAENDEQGLQILEKNNVIFGKYCWQMIRTTDTGGVKLIYNGESIDGKCNNSGYSSQISNLSFNKKANSLAYFGYMYNPDTLVGFEGNAEQNSNVKYGKSVTHSNGSYQLVNTSTSLDNYHHYTCNNTSGVCSEVRYYYAQYYFFTLKNGKNIEDVIYDMLYADDVNKVDSNIKEHIDYWYRWHLDKYTSFIEDTVFCNNREISNLGGLDPNGGTIGSSISRYPVTFVEYNSEGNLRCSKENDRFSTKNEIAKLTYPVGLVTYSEMKLLNNYKIVDSGRNYWLLSPQQFDLNLAYGVTSERINRIVLNSITGTNGVRPSISLIPNIQYTYGDGSKNNPYFIKTFNISNVIINNNDNKGQFYSYSSPDNIEAGDSYYFWVSPKDGYSLKRIQILDEDGNIIDYDQTEDDEYRIIMPDNNVTITPIYEGFKNSISVEIVDETKELNVHISDLTQVEEGEIVNFSVMPVKGFKIKKLRIIDVDNNEISYITDDNKNYTFTMPNVDVTIIPSYEKVSNTINVEDNKNTKEIIIEVNDVKAVVYEETVRFTITPEEGYEVEKIEIIDNNDNTIEYRKTKNENEYEFIMPDIDVTIKPTYRKIESINIPDTMKNPNTGDKIFLIVLSTIISLGIGTIIYQKRDREY